MPNIPDLIAVRREADAAAVREPVAVADEAALAGKAAGQYHLMETDAIVAWNGAAVTARGAMPADDRQLRAMRDQIEVPTLDAALNSTVAGARHFVGGQRGGTFDLLPESAAATPDELGGMAFRRADGKLLRRREYDSFVVATAWDLSGNDCVPELQKAVNYAAKRGKALLWPASPYTHADGSIRPYIMRSALNLPAGFRLLGEYSPIDPPNKGNGGGPLLNRPRGTFLLMRDSAQFVHGGGASVLHLTYYYDEQDYRITADSSQPDGLKAFRVYPPTHRLTGDYNGGEIGHITALGAYDLVVADKDTCNPEKLYIHDIHGAVLNRAVVIPYASDIPRIDGLFLNLNSIAATLEARYAEDNTYSTVNLFTKVAKNSIPLLLGRVDDIHCYRVFAFGIAALVMFTHLGDSRDDGNGGGAHFVNSAGDICGYGVVLDRANMNGFGVKFDNCWFTPNVYSPVINGVGIDGNIGPALVYSTARDHHNQVFFNNLSVYGKGAGLITGSGERRHTFVAEDGGGAGTDIYVENSTFREYTGTLCTAGGWYSGWSRDRSKGRVHLGSNIVLKDVERQDNTLQRIAGGTPGALTNGTAQTMLVTRNLRIIVERSRCTLGTGPTGGGAIRLRRNGAEIAGFYFGAGETTAGKGPQFANPVADAYLRENDVVTITYDGMAGAADIAFSFTFENDLTIL